MFKNDRTEDLYVVFDNVMFTQAEKKSESMKVSGKRHLSGNELNDMVGPDGLMANAMHRSQTRNMGP